MQIRRNFNCTTRTLQNKINKLNLNLKKSQSIESAIKSLSKNENSIFINEIKINRKDLKYQKFSSFRGECEAYDNFNSFKEGFDIEKLIENNKI